MNNHKHEHTHTHTSGMIAIWYIFFDFISSSAILRSFRSKFPISLRCFSYTMPLKQTSFQYKATISLACPLDYLKRFHIILDLKGISRIKGKHITVLNFNEKTLESKWFRNESQIEWNLVLYSKMISVSCCFIWTKKDSICKWSRRMFFDWALVNA